MTRDIVLLLSLFLCFSYGIRLLGLKTTVRVVNRIPTYTTMFVSIDTDSGATSRLHQVNFVPSLLSPLNFAWNVSVGSAPLVYMNQHNAPLMTCLWSSIMKTSSTKLPVFSPFVRVWNNALYGIMGTSLVRIDPATANATVLTTKAYDGAAVQLFSSSSTLYTLSESGLFQYKQGLLSWP
jgi:hypothetical protein